MKQEHVDYSPSITTYLAECRNEKGYSVQDVASHLRVSYHYIEALENNDTARFPERVYILGFVRSYAKFLGIDPDYCVSRFKEEILHEETSSTLFFPVPLTSETSPSKKILFLSAAGLLFMITVGYGIKQWISAPSLPQNAIITAATMPVPAPVEQSSTPVLSPETAASIEDDTDTEEESEDSDPDTLAQTSDTAADGEPLSQTAAVLPSDDKTLYLEFSHPSWVEIKDNAGNVIVEKTFQPKENYSLSAHNGYTLRTGNAGGIHIKMGTDPARPLGKPGEVLSNLSLDAASLSAYLKQR